MTAAAEPSLLEVRQVTRRFPGVLALDRVNLVLRRGEVLAIVGENGAGKSTLMKILAGVDRPDAGSIELDGAAVEIDSVRAARRHGIALISQELNLADNLDVGANIYLGREPRRHGLIDRRAIERGAREALERIGLAVEPTTIVAALSIGEQQMVEIAKALSADARILIMDEPTSSLSQHETNALFRVVKELRASDVSVVYISHRLGEVRELADRVVVLRDGRNAGELDRDQITHDALVRLMVGRDIAQFYAKEAHTPGAPRLEAVKLRTPKHPGRELSFAIRAGELVAVAGLVGAGRTELLRVLFGIDPVAGGEVRIDGTSHRWENCRDAIRAGVALVPEDRKQQGVILQMSVEHNVGLAGLRANCHPGGGLNRLAERRETQSAIESLRIKTPSPKQIVQYLSGGNQQKVVLGKWLALKPKILLLDEPTRGVDVGAKQEIYRLMEALAAEGIAVLFVSSDLEEILGMSDRVLVMHDGRLAGELPRAALSEEAIMQLATGATVGVAQPTEAK